MPMRLSFTMLNGRTRVRFALPRAFDQVSYGESVPRVWGLAHFGLEFGV